MLLSGLEAHLSSDPTLRTSRSRAQRSLDSSWGGNSDPDNIIVSVPAFGRKLYLNLTRSRLFLSREFVVEERRSDQDAALSRLSANQLCFYSGSVINHTSSLASVSTCGGLVTPPWLLWIVYMCYTIQSKQLSTRAVHYTNAPQKVRLLSAAPLGPNFDF